MQTRVREILDQEAEAVRKIPVTESYSQAIELMHKHVHLWERASVGLFTGGPAEVCPLGLTPTTSTTVMTVIGDEGL
jgi:hypothetical protein